MTTEQTIAKATAEIEAINARSAEMGWENRRSVDALTLTNMLTTLVARGRISRAEYAAAVAALAPEVAALRAERAAARGR